MATKTQNVFPELKQELKNLQLANANLFKVIHEQEKVISAFQHSNDECRTFVSVVIQQVRTPLATLSDMLQNATELSAEARDAKLFLIKKLISEIDLFTQEVGSFISGISKEKTFEKVNWNSMFEQAMASYQPLAEGDNVRFVLNTSEADTVYNDTTKMKVILNNLVSNSIKYRKRQSPLQISAKIKTAKDGTTIELKDNGSGMDAKDAEKVFNLFYNIHNSEKGSGMGLYIVKELVKSMRGTVKVKSLVNKGTSFILKFPAPEVKSKMSSNSLPFQN